jgi:2-polyprenyl-3-methyl-5-hydroxy-6-metoxy-1,4-benzoquinol methylase
MNCIVCRESQSALFTVKNGHAIFFCTRCGLLFVHPTPQSADIYSADYFTGATHGYGYVNYDEDKEPMVPAFKTYLRLIADVLQNKGKLLDVGAATGFFVKLARDAGFDASGVEISDHAASVGRKNGLAIATGTLEDVTGAFDCITMLDLIEHVPDPRGELRLARARLASGGVLVINTPDAGSLFARVMGKRWHLIVPPEHVYYFNRDNLARLLDEEGFDVSFVTTIGKAFTLKYVFKMLHKWTKLWLFGALARAASHRLVSRLAIPINLYDNMFILARKR